MAAAGKVAVPHRGHRHRVGLHEVGDEQVGQQKAAAGKAVLQEVEWPAKGGDDVEARARQEVDRAPRLSEDVSVARPGRNLHEEECRDPEISGQSNLTAPAVCKPAEMSGKMLMSFLENKRLIKVLALAA